MNCASRSKWKPSTKARTRPPAASQIDRGEASDGASSRSNAASKRVNFAAAARGKREVGFDAAAQAPVIRNEGADRTAASALPKRQRELRR